MKNFLKISCGHIFSENIRNFVTLIEISSDSWNKNFSNVEFNGDIDP